MPDGTASFDGSQARPIEHAVLKKQQSYCGIAGCAPPLFNGRDFLSRVVFSAACAPSKDEEEQEAKKKMEMGDDSALNPNATRREEEETEKKIKMDHGVMLKDSVANMSASDQQLLDDDLSRQSGISRMPSDQDGAPVDRIIGTSDGSTHRQPEDDDVALPILPSCESRQQGESAMWCADGVSRPRQQAETESHSWFSELFACGGRKDTRERPSPKLLPSGITDQ